MAGPTDNNSSIKEYKKIIPRPGKRDFKKVW